MEKYISLIAVISFIAGFVFMFQFFVVRNHALEGKESEIHWPFWPYQEKLFNDAGKKLCKSGKTIFTICYGSALTYAILKYLI